MFDLRSSLLFTGTMKNHHLCRKCPKKPINAQKTLSQYILEYIVTSLGPPPRFKMIWWSLNKIVSENSKIFEVGQLFLKIWSFFPKNTPQNFKKNVQILDTVRQK